ncbi:MAG: glycosyltransferase [Bacteroidetes bacterium]|nr:glycosyltransferase [Bacteroidota bacterium]
MKRIFDIISSLLGLIVLSPLLIILAFWVGLSSKGGVFYAQTRVGRGNKDFKVLKFRSMALGSDQKGLLSIGKDGRDPRVTRVGYVLRRYKLDELPQLLNVLKGDMSLVGPRPEVRKYVNLYNKAQLEVLKVRPGITDMASIAFKNENDLLAKADNPEEFYVKVIMPDKINMSLKYLNERSFLKDLHIIFKTILG